MQKKRKKESNSFQYSYEYACTRFKSKVFPINPILVAFRSTHDRLSFIAALKKNKGLTGRNIGINDTKIIHVGEHLTMTQHKLLSKAKEMLYRSGIYRHVWVQNDSILERRANGDKVKKIKCVADIVRLYGVVE